MTKRTHTTGQALVEFALSATLIFFLLCASVDLGLIFFAIQGLRNAAQEGATYGSRWLITDQASGVRMLNANLIRTKVRFESGEQGGIGFVNLLDLDGNGVDDSSQPDVLNQYISIQTLADPDLDGDPLNNGTAPDYTVCTNPSTSSIPCYAYVTVRAKHKLVFPLSPAFANDVMLTSSYLVLIRDSYAQGGSDNLPPVFATATPTPSTDDIVIEFVNPSSAGTVISSNNSTAFEVRAYDKNKGTTNGAGIASVDLVLQAPAGLTSSQRTDVGKPYCMYGDNGSNCSKMPSANWNAIPSSTQGYTYTFTATAKGLSGTSNSKTITLIIKK